ncbi:MAG: hypothetical protein JWO38_1504 [Gemmataceae bacterium]|nr:hypothetical protein [Gemmataceae bacterium]
MRRFLGVVFAAGAVVALATGPAPGLMIAMKSPAERALSADVVVVGKVTAIEQDAVEAVPFPGAPNKVRFKVAVVKVESSLAGAGTLTHIKVGFVPPPPPAPPQPAPQPGLVRPPIRRPGVFLPELKEGEEYILFLVKHPETGFYVMPGRSPPLTAKGDEAKKEIEGLKKVLGVVADPAKALAAEKLDDRAFGAAVLISKYRTYPDLGGEVEQVPVPVEESRLILKALAAGDWTRFDRTAPNGMQAFYQLGLTEQDGWVAPKPVPAQPGQPPANFNLVVKEAFVKWLDGPGKDYRVKRIVPKKQ